MPLFCGGDSTTHSWTYDRPWQCSKGLPSWLLLRPSTTIAPSCTPPCVHSWRTQPQVCRCCRGDLRKSPWNCFTVCSIRLLFWIFMAGIYWDQCEFHMPRRLSERLLPEFSETVSCGCFLGTRFGHLQGKYLMSVSCLNENAEEVKYENVSPIFLVELLSDSSSVHCQCIVVFFLPSCSHSYSFSICSWSWAVSH